tara:strand:+ start:23 stop:541 length:519 start_codon:yes stop_codon:yes gene_type:complete
MIKILSGKFKGRKLNHLKSNFIRPTQAIVRKSIMDSIMIFDNKRILDLCCGVGTLGIESLSRGCKYVKFVDKNRKAISILVKNLRILAIQDECDIIKSDIVKFLKYEEEKYDIIFADPPYDKIMINDIFPYIKKILNNGGIFIYESKKNNFKLEEDFKFKLFGNTQITSWEK